MGNVYNRARMSTTTAGTGTITLGSAVSGYDSFANAGVRDNDLVSYCIEDGTDFELGYGTYTASGTTLARTTLVRSSTGSKLNLSGSAQVFITPMEDDFQASSIGSQIALNQGSISL